MARGIDTHTTMHHLCCTTPCTTYYGVGCTTTTWGGWVWVGHGGTTTMGVEVGPHHGCTGTGTAHRARMHRCTYHRYGYTCTMPCLLPTYPYTLLPTYIPCPVPYTLHPYHIRDVLGVFGGGVGWVDPLRLLQSLWAGAKFPVSYGSPPNTRGCTWSSVHALLWFRGRDRSI